MQYQCRCDGFGYYQFLRTQWPCAGLFHHGLHRKEQFFPVCRTHFLPDGFIPLAQRAALESQIKHGHRHFHAAAAFLFRNSGTFLLAVVPDGFFAVPSRRIG